MIKTGNGLWVIGDRKKDARRTGETGRKGSKARLTGKV